MEMVMYLLLSLASLAVIFYLGYLSGYSSLQKALSSKYISAAYYLVNELENYEQLASSHGTPSKVKKRSLKRLRRKARVLFSTDEWAKK